MNREKVIKGLEICRHRVISQENCKECPYIYDGRAKQSNCEGVLHWDALALLKEQEEKLKFLDALYNYINPNDMEKYMQMYKSLPIPSDGRSVK